MIRSTQWFRFELPDEWWEAAGMNGFATYRTAYRRPANPNTLILSIADIGVQQRAPEVPDLDRDRLISVLEAIRFERPLPPIEVTVSP